MLFSSYIDDIDLEDHGEKRKEQSIFGALNKKKLAGKFQAMKGLWQRIQFNVIIFYYAHYLTQEICI